MTGTKTFALCSTALALMLTVSAAMAQELSLAGKVIGITTIRSDNQADRLFYQSAIAEAERLGAEVIALDAQSNDQTQVSQIQTLIAQKPDAVIEILGNIDVLNPWLGRVKEAGIPLFTIDTTTPHALNTVASDNYAIGSSMALQMIADLNGKGNILVFNGFYSVPPCKIRYDQMRYVVANFPDVKIIEPELRDVIPNTAQRAYSDTTDMLTKYPNDGDIGAVWACWDVPLIGVTQAIDGAGRKGIRTYGVDGTADFLSMIEDPNSAAGAVVIQDLMGMGKASVQNVAHYLAGDKVPPFTFVPHIMVTKENAAEVVPTLPAAD